VPSDGGAEGCAVVWLENSKVQEQGGEKTRQRKLTDAGKAFMSVSSTLLVKKCIELSLTLRREQTEGRWTVMMS